MTFEAINCKEKRMLALNPRNTPVKSCCVLLRTVPAIAVVMGLLYCAGVASAERLYPVALMNWMVEGSFFALIADKSQQRLSVWHIKDGEPSMVESFRCSTGENGGDKWVRGDMRTPEGVYFFCSVIDGRTLPSKYGLWAFTTDYPNFVDRRRGKNGDGIWLHGRDKPLGAKPDSNGCIALENQDLLRVSRYIRLQSTPLIVVDEVRMAPRSVVMEQERELRDFIERWRQNWESRNLDKYMAHYSPNFQSCWLDHRGWKEKKRKLNERYRNIRVKLGSVYLYRQNGLITSIFTQSYGSDGYQSTGIKVLYITHDSRYSIYAEDYHRPVDDPFPVATLLARNGIDAGPQIHDRKELHIRLVSTDEPDRNAIEDGEMPRRSAPSRGVVLEKIAGCKEVLTPPIETNEKCPEPNVPERLCVEYVCPAGVTDADLALQPPANRCRMAKVSEPLTTKEAGGATRVQAKPLDGESQGLTASLSQPSIPVDLDAKKMSNNRHDELIISSSNSSKLSENRKNILEFLEKWKTAWEQKDLDRFVKMYHPQFGQGNMDYEMFRKSKKNFFRKYRTIRVEIERVEIRKAGDALQVSFVQSFQGDSYRDKGRKTMVLAGGKEKGYQIVQEGWSRL